jgi:hypothetical protein
MKNTASSQSGRAFPSPQKMMRLVGIFFFFYLFIQREREGDGGIRIIKKHGKIRRVNKYFNNYDDDDDDNNNKLEKKILYG